MFTGIEIVIRRTVRVIVRVIIWGIFNLEGYLFLEDAHIISASKNKSSFKGMFNDS